MVEKIAAATSHTFADQVVVFTDQSFTKTAATNAKKIFWARQRPEWELDERVAMGAASLHEPTSIRSFLKDLGCSGAGYAAALRAIANGVLMQDDDGPLGPDSRVLMGGLS